MGNRTKKALAIALAVMCMFAFSFTGVFAASSPTSGEKQDYQDAGEYTVNKSAKTADLVKVYKKGVTTKNIFQKVTINGKKYTVKKVKANAFKGCTKLKVIKIRSHKLSGFSKDAFKGLKKSQVKKIKVKVNKKMSKKNYKKLVKQLVAAGISKKNIKRVSF